MLCLSFEHINLEICYKQFLNDTKYVYKTPTNKVNIHPIIFFLSELLWQQQDIPDVVFPSNIFQFFLGDLEIFPGRIRYNLSCVLMGYPGPLFDWACQ